MHRIRIFVLLLFTFISCTELLGVQKNYTHQILNKITLRDTLEENQGLYIGRIWQNLYYLVEEGQFLFSRMFLPGTVTIGGKNFNNVLLKYDIYKDEILTPLDSGGILQLNKEMVDSFSIFFQDRSYRFIRMKEDSTKAAARYFNVLYQGKTSLYLRYSKKIDKTPLQGHDDRFYELVQPYFVKANIIYPIDGKGDLLKILNKEKTPIKSFIKKNRLSISGKEPESFIPVIRYYDSISK
jgi:hypothetical protein